MQEARARRHEKVPGANGEARPRHLFTGMVFAGRRKAQHVFPD